MQYVICMYNPIFGQEHFEYRGLITSNKGSHVHDKES